MVPNATVVVTSQATQETRITTTNSSGEYRVVNLAPGLYTVSIKATSSFAAFLEKNVPIEVTRESRVDATLPASTVTTEVTVDTAAPMLETDSAEVNHEISQEQISQIPITGSQGRNFQSLYTLIPGAAAVQEQNSIGGNPARAMSINFNGVSYNTNTTRIDGAVNDYGWLPYLLAYLPPADSIQTVNVVTNSFNAEQGVAGGASIAITLKGGTNQYHGSAWEYYQDANINARTYTATQASLISPTIPLGRSPRTSSMSSEPTSAAPSISQNSITARTSFSSSKTLSVRPQPAHSTGDCADLRNAHWRLFAGNFRHHSLRSPARRRRALPSRRLASHVPFRVWLQLHPRLASVSPRREDAGLVEPNATASDHRAPRCASPGQ